MDINAFAPRVTGIKESLSKEEAALLLPFFTNLDKSVYGMAIPSPELVGAICSRTSRAAGDLRTIFLKEFIQPFLERTAEESDADWNARKDHAEGLRRYITMSQGAPIHTILANPRARKFYATWLAQYGDDSIAEMGGMHLAYAGLSQVALKHLEDQRIGLSPIEKSTRYVNYGEKVGERYLYYSDPTLAEHGLLKEYEEVMDGLFETYKTLLPILIAHLGERFPKEKPGVIEKKAFDTLRGLLPMSTLSQVAFSGNGRAFEYLVNRGARHALGEIRWAADEAKRELGGIASSFFRRLDDPEKEDQVKGYQDYLSGKTLRMDTLVADMKFSKGKVSSKASVRLLDADPEGEFHVISGMLYPSLECSFDEVLTRVRKMKTEELAQVVDEYFKGRTERYQKVGRALEHAYLSFEVEMNNGAYRDLHRERMKTQQRQRFTVRNGYDIPPEIVDVPEIRDKFVKAIERTHSLFEKIAAKDADLAQYASTLAHRVRFVHRKNLRECFWEVELRTIPEGHPDYRHIMQEEYQILRDIYPILVSHMKANIGEYDFARRGQEERIARKQKELSKE